MTKEQMENLEKCLVEERYRVDIHEGRIYSNYNGKEKEIGGYNKIGKYYIHRVCFTLNGKRYFFQTGEIIAYLIGMFDNLEEPEKYMVIVKNKKERPHLHNIALAKIKSLGYKYRFKELEHKRLIKYFKGIFPDEKVAEVFGCSVSTVERIKLGV